jgi:hypothetical protein
MVFLINFLKGMPNLTESLRKKMPILTINLLLKALNSQRFFLSSLSDREKNAISVFSKEISQVSINKKALHKYNKLIHSDGIKLLNVNPSGSGLRNLMN